MVGRGWIADCHGYDGKNGIYDVDLSESIRMIHILPLGFNPPYDIRATCHVTRGRAFHSRYATGPA